MGGRGAFLSEGGFTHEEYRVVRRIADVKVLKHIGKGNESLPMYSNTPHTAYIRENSKGNLDQVRFYRGRRAMFDIDWGHGHGKFKKGIPHLHVWIWHRDGTYERSEPRCLTPKEKKVLEKLLSKIRGD